MTRRIPRLPRIFRTFRFRLSALYLAIFGTLQIALAVAILFVRELEVRREFDERLFNRATALGLAISDIDLSAGDEPMQRRLADLLRHSGLGGYVAQIQRHDGTVLAQSGDAGNVGLLEIAARSLDDVGPRPRFTTWPRPATDGLADASNVASRIRVISIVPRRDDGMPLVIHVGHDTTMLEESIQNLRRLILFVGLSGLAIAAGASWFVAKLSLRPIEKIVRETQQISPRDLSTRLTVPGTHDEIDRVVMVFNSLLQRIERGFEAHERFAADVAHELKTPLTVIQSEVQLLTRGDPSTPQWRSFARSAEDEMRRMSRLVDALLMAARAKAGYPLPTHDAVDIADVVVTAVDQCLAQARDQKVALAIRPGVADAQALLVRGDADLLVAALVNLIRNAIRASPAGQSVEVDAMADDVNVAVVISDRGAGVPASRRARLFGRFDSIPPGANAVASDISGSSDDVSGGSSSGGEGLGLSIVRSIVSLHRGVVEACDRNGGGSEFTMRLPRDAASELA